LVGGGGHIELGQKRRRLLDLGEIASAEPLGDVATTCNDFGCATNCAAALPMAFAAGPLPSAARMPTAAAWTNVWRI
jgi:hypothetical protein